MRRTLGSFVVLSILLTPLSVRAYSLPASSLVISRSAWGADESLLFQTSTPPPEPASPNQNGGSASAPQNRVDDCTLAQQNHPAEFRSSAPVTQDAAGRRYRWPLSYSNEVKLLVVHHTALKVTGDPRSGAERVRALYKYHAESRGWGDVGYHYLIDEEGKIYEGRQGGKNVVGGHAYCNNVGTIGVALLGNFDLEAPTAAQTTALQTLLIRLADDYNLNLNQPTTFHGKTFVSPIVGHDDLVATGCPGHYLDDAFGQIINNVRSRNPNGTVRYSVPVAPPPRVVIPDRVSSTGMAEGLSYIGRTTLSINPGSQQRMSFVYTAPQGGAYEGKKVADVQLGHKDLQLFLTQGSQRIPIRTGLLLPYDLPDGEAISLQLIVQAPQAPGTYWMQIGGVKFTLVVSGRRIRTDVDLSDRFGSAVTSNIVNTDPVRTVTAVRGRVRPHTRRSMGAVTASAPVTRPMARASVPAPSTDRSIRIRLSSSATPELVFTTRGSADETEIVAGSRVQLRIQSGVVQAIRGGSILTSGPILRFAAGGGGTVSVDSVRSAVRSYRGILEARIVDGSLALINELPLETYMRGLSEEPDTEPYEKQRAFAIAARTYAAWYMDPNNRKFPGKPYDGSDDPAVFQSYSGADFEARNPSWLRALAATDKQVLTYQGSIIKPPYFSSDNGRTRSPEEAGWKNFPFASIFSSKADPWCAGFENRGHGVGMSGCGAEAQANQGKTAEDILQYYYPGTAITQLGS